jgi:hypothetical protein
VETVNHQIEQEKPFIMTGARKAISAGLYQIKRQVEAIESLTEDNPNLVFDLAKTIVESTCKTIISERNGEYNKTDNLSKLLKTAADFTPFLPIQLSGNTEVRMGLTKALQGLATTIQGICELRNTAGFASHGKDTLGQELECIHATLLAQAADAIVGFLYCTHKQDRSKPDSPEQIYERNLVFNEWIDSSFGQSIVILECSFKPSEVLFALDSAYYEAALAEFVDDSVEDDD